MKLTALHIARAPGLPDGLPALDFGPGLTIVLGPNASGKSTLAQTIHALLWPHEAPPAATTSVHSTWTQDDQELRGDILAGQVLWQPTTPSGIRSGAASLARFDLRSLLASEDAGDRRLAAKVARELAGGLDLRAAASSFGTSPTLSAHRSLRRELETAKQQLEEANRRATGLFEKERQLTELKAEIEVAKRDGLELEAAKKLRELVLARESLAELQAQFEAFEPGLDELRGDEATRIDELTADLDAVRGELKQTETTRADLEASRGKLEFPDGAPKRPDLDAWSKRLDTLAESSSRVQNYREDVAEAEHTCRELRASVAAEEPAGDLSSATLDRLPEELRALQEARAKVRATREVAGLWSSLATGDEEDLEALRVAIRDLRTFLRLPAPTLAASSPAWLSLVLLGLGALALLLGLVAALQDLPSWLPPGALIAFGFGVFVLGFWLRRAVPGDRQPDERGSLRDAVARSGLAPPGWSPADVEAHLEQLERRRTLGEQQLRAAERVRTAAHDLESAESDVAQLESDLSAIAASAGVTSEFLGLGMAQEVHALFRWREAEERATGQRAKLAEAERTLAEGLRASGAYLQTFGYDAPEDVAQARASLRALEERAQSLDHTRTELTGVERDHTRLLATITRHETELAKCWDRSGVAVGEQVKLALRMKEHEAWSELLTPLRDARQRHERARERFQRGGALPRLVKGDPNSIAVTEVEAWIDDLAISASQHGELKEKQGAIQRELELATERHDLGDALANLRAVEERVAAARHEAAEDTLAARLLDEIGSHERAGSGSELILEVQKRFGSFTQHGWLLELNSEGEFCARDQSTGELRSLEQLSDGTRIQLLLAARLTALQDHEPNGPLPISLDEALSTSDPQRFEWIAKALLDEVAQGRQILYFTADPNEAELWKRAAAANDYAAPHVLDLGRASGVGADWGGQLLAVPAQPDPIPDPRGKSHAEYARELGVPLPDGHAGPSSWHLYFVAYDDLAPLATCLRQRITTLGQWRAVRAAGELPSGLDEEVAERFDLRAHLCETLAGLWLEGRGRPVTWSDVQASSAVSDIYAERVRALLVESAGEARHFMEAVRGLKGFRGNKADELEAHLETVGCLSLDEPLLPDELVRRTLGSVGSLDALGNAERAAAYCDWLVGLLGQNEA